MNGRAASSATVNWVQRSCAISAAERHPSSASRYPRVVGYLVSNGTAGMCHRRSPLSLGSARGRPHPGPRLGVPVAATRPPGQRVPRKVRTASTRQCRRARRSGDNRRVRIALRARAPRVTWRMTTVTVHQSPPRRRLARLRPVKLPPPVNPALMKQAEARADAFGNRIADTITRFAGSMQFVYLHVLWFGCWIGFGVESYPYGLLTMIVSLEAIFLSTFVMISQNRADEKQQALADQEWKTVKEEDQQNEELLQLSHQILSLTEELHALASDRGERGSAP